MYPLKGISAVSKQFNLFYSAIPLSIPFFVVEAFSTIATSCQPIHSSLTGKCSNCCLSFFILPFPIYYVKV
ncbi:hypothetical protein CW304_19500 [Bacillus sp. UFRGS-B20]|nr:hypothetical protein CW304_19500 [Bacillus sp. UFRGS-B20]